MLKQKLYAIITFIIGIIIMLVTGEGTLALLTTPLAIFLFFSKFDYTM